jgi:hypothetical protein
MFCLSLQTGEPNMERRKPARTPELGPYKRHELLTGEICYPEPGYYSGYGDGRGTDLTAFISDEMRRDWTEHREVLIKFWKSGAYTAPDVFPDSKPWLFVRGEPGTLPWAAEHLGGPSA